MGVVLNVAAQDAVALKALLAPDVIFRALTPGKSWESEGADTVGYGSRGETMTFDRDSDGSIRSVRGGSGSIAYPIDQFRAAIAGRDRVTLGAPIRPG